MNKRIKQVHSVGGKLASGCGWVGVSVGWRKRYELQIFCVHVDLSSNVNFD